MQLLLRKGVEQHVEIRTRLAGKPSGDTAARGTQATCRSLAQPAFGAPGDRPQHLEVFDQRL
jgi:hypothetical protein